MAFGCRQIGVGAEEIADAIVYAASRPEDVSVNEMLIRPTSQLR